MRYLFVIPPSLFIAILHGYLWLRLVHDTRLRGRSRRIATVLLAGLWALFPATFIVWFRIHSANPVHFALAFGWLGAIGYAVAILAAWDGVRLTRWALARLRGLRRPGPAQPPAAAPSSVESAAARETTDLESRQTRRVFVARSMAGGALVAAGGVAVFGSRAALWDITTPEVAVGLPRLPRQLDGYTIALLTDIHVGPVLSGRFLRQLVEQTNRMRPDAIAIGGDLVDGRVIEIGQSHVAELRHLRARDGVYYVTGNHEYYWGPDAWMGFVRSLGVRVLLNERVTLGDASAQGAQFDFVGLPDHRAGWSGHLAPDIQLATRDRDDQRELVVLAHQPVQIDESVTAAAGLQLSGHTHGGQLQPFGAVAAAWSQPYLAGLHQHRNTPTQIYVSRGAGFWGPPLRVGAPAEITKVRLFRA